MSSRATPPPWLWRGVVLALAVVLGGGVGLWSAIRWEWTTPRPPEPAEWRIDEPVVLQVPPPEQQALELLGEPMAAFTVEARAKPRSESTFSEYGLVFRAQSSEQYAVFAVGSDGYLAVLAREGERETAWFNWQAFPHVQQGEASNRLRVACAVGECHFWINDEHVTSLPDHFGPGGRVGVWAGRMTEAPLEVTFDGVSVWEGGPPLRGE